MASDGSDQDARYTLSKLMQRGTVAEYKSEFLMLIKQVTGISESLLKSFYMSGLKPVLQCALLRSNPTTLSEAFSSAHATEARFAEDALSKLLQRGTVAEYQNEFEMLIREAFSLACTIEARFEAIAHEEKATASIKETANTITSLQSEVASLKAKGSLDANKETREDRTLVHELEKQHSVGCGRNPSDSPYPWSTYNSVVGGGDLMKFIHAEVECSSSPIFTSNDICHYGHIISPLNPTSSVVAGIIWFLTFGQNLLKQCSYKISEEEPPSTYMR
ncbi:hypothetical protein Tco_0757167 [Tanacetum coccineum]